MAHKVGLLVLLVLGTTCQGFQQPPLFQPSVSTTVLAPSATQIHPTEQSRRTRIKLFYREEGGEDGSDLLTQDQRNIEMANNFLLASRRSFKNVEGLTLDLLNGQPLLALGIFVTCGLMTAYMLGFFFLGGYIENWNPVENDSIPYWDDEVLVIARKVGR